MNRFTARRDDTLVAHVSEGFALDDGRGVFVRAGSALVAVGRRLLAVQDDALAAVWIDPRSRALESVVLAGDGGALPKAEKPDFEAAFALDGRVWVLGSGATAQRRRVAHLGPGRPIALLDRHALYDALEAVLGMPPNIEGAVPSDDRLRLFHRGPGRHRDANFTLEVPLGVLDGAAPRILEVVGWDLGAIGGLHLGFTDAAPLGDGRVAYLAVAEDTPDGIADGPIAGAVMGVMTSDAARWAPIRETDGAESRRKFEGLVVDPDGAGGWLITDPDDPLRPAELCRFTWGG